jgi:hypothetical protein
VAVGQLADAGDVVQLTVMVDSGAADPVPTNNGTSITLGVDQAPEVIAATPTSSPGGTTTDWATIIQVVAALSLLLGAAILIVGVSRPATDGESEDP